MNTIQQGITALLKSAVTGEENQLPRGFSLEQVQDLTRKHNMLTLVYEGALHCGISRQDPLMRKMFAEYCQHTLISEAQMADVNRVCKAFEQAGIAYMPLKGCRMKLLYPRPELRIMADADILIRTEQYDQIVSVMKGLGFSQEAETDHELIWNAKGLQLELHKRLIPSYNKDFYAYYGDGWKFAKPGTGFRYFMEQEDEWIFLFTHFAKHYRDGGIGCRHVLDLWVWRRSHLNMDEAYIHSALKSLHLDVFYSHILRLLSLWFADGEPDDVLNLLTESIFSGGSFGDPQAHALAQVIRDQKCSALGGHSKLLYLRQQVFPGAATLQGNYPILKKAPWMLPAVWVFRLFYKLLFAPKILRQKMKNLSTLSREKRDLRQEHLRTVGLDYPV